MAEQSSRVQIPYPSRFDQDWFGDFQSFMAGVDASVFSIHDRRNVWVAGGGTLSWNATTSELTWSAALEFMSPTFGKKHTVAADTVTVADGDFVWVALTTGLTGSAALALQASATVPVDLGNMVFAYRLGTTMYFVQGLVLEGGESSPLGAKAEIVTLLSDTILDDAIPASGIQPTIPLTVDEGASELSVLPLGDGAPIST